MEELTHRSEIVFKRDGYLRTIVVYGTVSIGWTVDPRKAAIAFLEELAAKHSTTLADCEAYSIVPIEKVSRKQKAEDMRAAQTKPERVERLKANPYR